MAIRAQRGDRREIVLFLTKDAANRILTPRCRSVRTTEGMPVNEAQEG